MTKKVEPAPRSRSIEITRSKLQFGSVRRRRWTGTLERARASRSAARPRPASACDFSRAAAPRTPIGVQRQGVSTSCVSATANFAPPQRGGSAPSRFRSRSSGGSSGSRHEADAGNRPCWSRGPVRSSTRARWKNASAISSPWGRSPRSTCSQASGLQLDFRVRSSQRLQHPAARAPGRSPARTLPGRIGRR